MIWSVAVVKKKADSLPQGVISGFHRLELDRGDQNSNHVLEGFEVESQVDQVAPLVGEDIDDQRE